MKHFGPFLSIAMTLILLGPPTAAQGKGGGKGGAKPDRNPVSMTVAFRDCPEGADCGAGDPAADRIKSDLLGAYVDGVDQVEAVGKDGWKDQDDAFLELDTDTSEQETGPRTVFLDFSDPALCPDGCSPLFEQGDVKAFFHVKLRGLSKLEDLQPGQSSGNATLKLFWSDEASGNDWFVRFNPDFGSGNRDLEGICQHSATLTVTRVDADTWEVTGGGEDVACLLEMRLGRGKTRTDNRGYYRMPFRMVFQRK